jgi:GT2 family glycosyltransferase
MAESLNLSIIIPTCNRKNLLYKCLEALSCQRKNVSKTQIIVVNDGKSFSFKRLIKEIKFPVNVKSYYFENQKKGPAAARNLGIKKAVHNIILFLGDDILATSDLIEKHLEFHQNNEEINKGFLGRVIWYPNISKSNFMDWLEVSGMQADYSIADKKYTDFSHFYTTNISLKKEFLLKNNLFFDEDFIYPLFEDTEYGYRLFKKGFKLFYSQHALAYHWHQLELNSYLQKMKLRGAVGNMFLAKHPELWGIIFPIDLPLKEKIRLECWHLLYPLGSILNIRRILFENYQRLCNSAIKSGFNTR